MSQPSEVYVTGLLAELEPEVPRLERELAAARERARRIDAELSALLTRMDATKAALAARERAAQEAALVISGGNARMAALHQEIAAIQKRASDFKAEMERVGPGAAHNELRRERAKLLVQIEDREQEIQGLMAGVAQGRATLGEAEAGAQEEKDRTRLVMGELDRLQTQLPRPHLFLKLFEATAGRAHCRLYLDREPVAWEAELRRGVGVVGELHRELRAGKYRLDKNSDVVGGRAAASVEAAFAAVALGDRQLAVELFGLIADPALRFDHIFHVFRLWCLGLYLTGERRALEILLRRHRYSPGLRGGYVEAFSGLAGKEARRVSAGLKSIARHEWDVWLDPGLTRGAGVVSLGATGVARLALDAGLAVSLPGPTVPDVVIAGPRRTLAARLSSTDAP